MCVCLQLLAAAVDVVVIVIIIVNVCTREDTHGTSHIQHYWIIWD